jgi:flavin reductase (DIM6/NTAB) family NADH-FMN oxidoreductase RutF
MAVDKGEFRQALGQYASAVTVVTAQHEGARLGITVTAFCSLSLEPPLVLVCIGKRARMHPALEAGELFAVNFLAADQQYISQRFASPDPDPFRDIATKAGKLGTLQIDGSLAAIECRIVDRLPGGDHTIFVGQVEASDVGHGQPLLHFRGQYHRLAE